MNILTITPESSNINVDDNNTSGLLNVSTSSNINTLTNIYPTTSNISINSTTGPSVVTVSGVNSLANIVNISSASYSNTVVSGASGVYSSYGRLSLASNNPIYNTDITNNTIYYTPYLGNKLSLYDSSTSSWSDYTFSELSLSLLASTNDTNYDIFIYYNGNSLVMEKIAWLNNSNRNSSLILQDGIYVLSTDAKKRYVGSIRTTSTSTTEDSKKKRFVWNNSNKIVKQIYATDSVLHTYTTASYRPYKNITTSGITRIEFISGIDQYLSVSLHSDHFNESNFSSVALGLDSTSNPNIDIINGIYVSAGSPYGHSNISTSSNTYVNTNLGYHYIQILQYGSSISTFNKAILSGAILC